MNLGGRMPKLKTHSGAKKRFRVKNTGVKFRRTNRNHILTKKPNKRMRRLRTNGLHLCDAARKIALKLVNKRLKSKKVSSSNKVEEAA